MFSWSFRCPRSSKVITMTIDAASISPAAQRLAPPENGVGRRGRPEGRPGARGGHTADDTINRAARDKSSLMRRCLRGRLATGLVNTLTVSTNHAVPFATQRTTSIKEAATAPSWKPTTQDPPLPEEVLTG